MSVLISDGIETIGERAFCGCAELKNVQFAEGSNLSVIQARAFGKTAVERVQMPGGLRTIEQRAF